MSKKQQAGKKESIIQNYGLFWREDRVKWKGVKGAPASLYGVAKGEADTRVNFKEQRGIYALYANYKLVYVGQTTGALLTRLRLHRRVDDCQGRWDMFSWFGTRYVTGANKLTDHSDINVPQQPTARVLDVLEGLVIAISEPQLNSQGAKWKKLGVTRYYQWWDEDEGDDDREEDETE